MNKTNFEITIDVLPDIQAKESGETLDRLFLFLKKYKNLEWLVAEEKKLKPDYEIIDWVNYFYKILNADSNLADLRHELKSDGIYCDLPITINLSEGEYALHNIALVYTNADFTIQGIENKSVIKFTRFL